MKNFFCSLAFPSPLLYIIYLHYAPPKTPHWQKYLLNP